MKKQKLKNVTNFQVGRTKEADSTVSIPLWSLKSKFKPSGTYHLCTNPNLWTNCSLNIDLEWVNNALKLRYTSIFQKRVIWNATNISDHPTHFWPIFLFHLFNSFHCFLSISCFYPIYHPFHLFTYLFLQWSFTRAHLKADGTTQNHALQIIYFVASLKLIIKLQWGNKFNNAL